MPPDKDFQQSTPDISREAVTRWAEMLEERPATLPVSHPEWCVHVAHMLRALLDDCDKARVVLEEIANVR